MKRQLRNLKNLYEKTEKAIRAQLEVLGSDECNCDNSEGICLVNDNGGADIGIDRRCGNCGGVIWDREI